jgi:hypothetical protein
MDGQGRMMADGMFLQGYVGGGFGLLVVLAVAVATVFAFWRIFSKAGFAGAWGLLAIFPFAQILLLLFLAFADWPSRGRPAERDA